MRLVTSSPTLSGPKPGWEDNTPYPRLWRKRLPYGIGMAKEENQNYSKDMKKKIASAILLASVAVVPLTFTTGCAVTQGRETVRENVDDKAITAKVKTKLYRDPVVKGTEVNVTTFKGTVQLSGFVDNQAQKDRAEQIAKETSGVLSVHNDLIVPTGR